MTYLNKERYEESLIELNKISKTNFNKAEILYQMGFIYNLQYKPDETVLKYNEALVINANIYYQY